MGHRSKWFELSQRTRARLNLAVRVSSPNNRDSACLNGFEILEGYEPTAGYLDAVQKAADDNRDALGFFARTVYEQFARAGCLYVAAKRTESGLLYAGHLLFSCSFPRAHVRQIFTLTEHRRAGLAALLLSRLKDSLGRQ